MYLNFNNEVIQFTLNNIKQNDANMIEARGQDVKIQPTEK